jgi:N-acetyl-1-D-myo-inositol-2-amino-2-deoxy-alpha-D-glucopyranoside deacetylase
MLVHAHPDDESLWTGGTIARYAAHGVQVIVVTCTLGEEGEIVPPSLRQLGPEHADQLGGYRVAELRSACAALGVTDHRFLGGIGRWRDSGMAGAPANRHARSLVAGDRGTQAAALAELLDEIRPQVVVTYDEHGGYGHPDHIRAHEITTAAAAGQDSVQRVFHAVLSAGATERGLAGLAEAPGLPFRLPEPGSLPVTRDERIGTVIDIRKHVSAKLSALRAHPTQISVWQDGAGPASYALSDGYAQPVVDAEYYVQAGGDPAGAETDLFGGLGFPSYDDAGHDESGDDRAGRAVPGEQAEGART